MLDRIQHLPFLCPSSTLFFLPPAFPHLLLGPTPAKLTWHCPDLLVASTGWECLRQPDASQSGTDVPYDCGTLWLAQLTRTSQTGAWDGALIVFMQCFKKEEWRSGERTTFLPNIIYQYNIIFYNNQNSSRV